MGILPTAWVASVCSQTPRSRQRRPISASGWMTPISLLANMTETSIVSSRMARRVAPRGCGRRADRPRRRPAAASLRKPRRRESRQGIEHGGVLGGDADEVFAAWAASLSAAPRMARLLLSVAPLVKTISLARAPMAAAIDARAASTASLAAQPKAWLVLPALPKTAVK